MRRDDLIINTAYSDFTTENLLDTYESQVAGFEPQVVFFMIVMNDCCQHEGKAQVTLPAFKKNWWSGPERSTERSPYCKPPTPSTLHGCDPRNRGLGQGAADRPPFTLD